MDTPVSPNAPALGSTRLGPGARRRPAPTLGDALAGGGGLVVALGAVLIAFDVFDGDPDNGPAAAFVMAALLAASFAGLALAPKATHPAWVANAAVAVFGVFGFLFLPDADSLSDARPFFILTIAAWTVCFLLPWSRGRGIFVALALTLVWLWVLGEVVGTDSYSRAPIPSPPFVTPAEHLDVLDGPDAVAAIARPGQEITLQDLDEGDPLYPLAQDCANGDDDACDELWLQSELESDFETFAESCGGRGERGFGTCANPGGFGDDLGDDLGDDFGDGLPDDFSVQNPLGTNDELLDIGLVSLAFALAYLGALRIADARGYRGIGTAFVLPGVWTIDTAVTALGAKTESWVAAGLMAVAAGLVLAVVGHLSGERRFTTWYGGAYASVGAVIIAFDVSSIEDSVDDGALDLLTPGAVTIAFGLALVALAFIGARLFGPLGGDTEPAAPGPPPAPPVAPQADRTDPTDRLASWEPPTGPRTPESGWGAPAAPPPPAPPAPPFES